MVSSGFLAEVERTDLDDLRRRYPEAFARPYHQGAGLCLERVLAGPAATALAAAQAAPAAPGRPSEGGA
jgi:hypothetical protein